VVDEAQAEVVREIFAMRDAGTSLRGIADRLNERDVPTKRGGTWHASTVKHMLDNPKYRGLMEHRFGGETVEREADALRIVE
jgi:DNA-binding transcriptional MerR regulator